MYIALGTVAGLGVGGVLVPREAIAMIIAPDSLIASVVALGLSIRVVGGSIGNAIYSNVFYNKISTHLPEYIVGYGVKAGLPLTSAVQFVRVLLTDPTKIVTVPGVLSGIRWTGESTDEAVKGQVKTGNMSFFSPWFDN